MQVSKSVRVDPDAYAVVMIGEVKCAVFKGSEVSSKSHLGALRPDYAAPSKMIVAVHRPDGCKAGIMPIGDDRKLAYVPLCENNAVLIPCSRDPGEGDEDDNSTTVNVTIH